MEKLQVNRLQFFPVMLFSSVMGLGGYAIAFKKVAELLSVPKFLSDIFVYVSLAAFVIVSLFYIAKCIFYPNEVKTEWRHPVRVNFFSAISISALIISIVLRDKINVISYLLFYIGIIMHTFLSFYTISFWINHNQEINSSNPAWFIPIVGNVLVPVAGFGIIQNEILIYYFSVGVFFWFILFALILNRIIFFNQMPEKFIPTLFIFIAPPALAFVAYFKLFQKIDLFANFFYSIALFFTFLLVFMFKRFLKLKFFVSWWAFVFPLAAMSIASILMYKNTQSAFFFTLSLIIFAFTSFVVLIVSYQTLKHIQKKQICVPE